MNSNAILQSPIKTKCLAIKLSHYIELSPYQWGLISLFCPVYYLLGPLVPTTPLWAITKRANFMTFGMKIS